ncbi:hypothetical protein ACWBEP_001165 [Escherichia albertii]
MFLPLPLLIGTLALYCKKRCQVIVKNQTPSSMDNNAMTEQEEIDGVK